MLTISDAVRRAETVDGEILLDVRQGQMFSLNVAGAKMLDLLLTGDDESQIVEKISQDYRVDRDVVRRDLLEFVESLRQHHILEPTPASAPATSVRSHDVFP